MFIALTSFEMPYSYYVCFVSGVNGEMVMTTNLVSVTLNVGSQNYTGFELATKLTS